MVTDSHLANTELFEVQDEGKLTFSIDQVSGNDKFTHSVRVVPKESKEHQFEPATFTYQTEKGQNAQTHNGVASNKPIKGDILSKRDYILKSSWHVQEWGVFSLLSLLSVGIPIIMWKSSSSQRETSSHIENQESKKVSSSSKKNKRA